MNRKSEILARLARSRAAIAQDASVVKSQLDLAARIKCSFRARPFTWLGGAATLGYILAGPKTRTKTVTKIVRENPKAPGKSEARKPRGTWGILLSLIKLSVPLLRPALSAYAAKRFGNFAVKK